MQVDIDHLIEIVNNGGAIRTGVDIYNRKGVLLLEKHVRVEKVKPLEVIQQCGITALDIDPRAAGGLWDGSGTPLSFPEDEPPPVQTAPETTGIGEKIREINEQKIEAAAKYSAAKNSIKKVEFDVEQVKETVSDVFEYLTRNASAFFYLTKEIFSYDDYLYNHSVNVCIIATAILNHFNCHFSEMVNHTLTGLYTAETGLADDSTVRSYVNYPAEDLRHMSLAYFIHDVGKVLIPDHILNKPGRLTPEEFEIVKAHSFEKGREILEKNRLSHPILSNVIAYHHAALYPGEQNCYPGDKAPAEIQPYVKVAKLADIYDAMTSKRCYKEALNPVRVVTDIFRKYANRDRLLQFILHSFVKSVGICPPGSMISLRNGQLCYVLSGEGPVVLPVTDSDGKLLKYKPDPLDLGTLPADRPELQVDRHKPLMDPIDINDQLPKYLREMIAQ